MAYSEKYDHVKRPWKLSENILKRRAKTKVLLQDSKTFSATFLSWLLLYAFVTSSPCGPKGNQMVNALVSLEEVAPLHAVVPTTLCTSNMVGWAFKMHKSDP